MRIEIKKPKGLKLKTAGKICDDDIIVVPKLQSKEVTVTGNTTVKPDVGYAGLSEVIVSVDVKAPECDHVECVHEELTCNLDFADSENGDILDEMIVPVPANTAYNKVCINRPEALTPEHIREGIQIAGVVGTLKTESKYSYAEGVTF